MQFAAFGGRALYDIALSLYSQLLASVQALAPCRRLSIIFTLYSLARESARAAVYFSSKEQHGSNAAIEPLLLLLTLLLPLLLLTLLMSPPSSCESVEHVIAAP